MTSANDPNQTKEQARPSDEQPGAFNGAPLNGLPDRGGVVAACGMQLSLYPPRDFEIALKIDAYLIVAPYARALLDISINGGPLRRKSIPARSGMVIPPGAIVRLRMIEPVELLFLGAEPETAEAVFRSVARDRDWAPAVIEAFTDPGFASAVSEIRRSLLGDPLNEPAYLKPLAESLFARIGCYYAGAALKAPSGKEALSPAILTRTLKTVNERLDEPLSVEGLAQDAGLSRSHFSRAFQASTGESLKDYIIGRRVSKARELLANTDLPLSKIAARTGFSSQTHFSSTFKKQIGLAPGQYRNTFKADDD